MSHYSFRLQNIHFPINVVIKYIKHIQIELINILDPEASQSDHSDSQETNGCLGLENPVVIIKEGRHQY